MAKKAAGELWVDADFVFTTRYGTPFEPRKFNRHFTDRSARAGGSLLAALDVHPRVAIRILRHSKITQRAPAGSLRLGL